MVLFTARLVLREFLERDWQALLAYQRDPLYLRYTPWSDRTEEDAREMVHTFIDWRDEQPRCKFQFALVLPAGDRLIGSCGIRQDSPESTEAEIGYELASSYWGRGLATEAAQALLAFGFWHLQLHRIWAHCLADNEASARVLERLGMGCEGRCREQTWMKGRWWDRLLYATLEQEWRARADACVDR